MRIGFASIFAFRPHVEHLYYLSRLAQQAGHEVRYLACDAQLPYCYGRALKGTGAARECPKCILGGMRSYAARVSSLPSARIVIGDEARAWADSSACTVLRIETADDRHGLEFLALRERLAAGAQRAFASGERWIAAHKLDALVCFNGRMDASRGLCEAARHCGIPFLTVERTLFGDGLQFAINDNALDLSQIDRLNTQYRDLPLTRRQSLQIAHHLAARFLKRNDREWRAYNRNALAARWPGGAGGHLRVLIAPGSRNEVDGHPHWTHGWAGLADGIDAVLGAIGASPRDAVLRCHPNWSERIGRRTGESSERYYTTWARRRGVHVISSGDQASTFDLIAQADLVVVTGGTAAFEASCLGKAVISLTPSAYRQAKVAAHVTSPDELHLAASAMEDGPDRARRGMRYAYTHAYRFSQYVDYVRAVTTTRYRYFEGADPARIASMLQTGRIAADDDDASADAAGEDEVLALVAQRDWKRLLDLAPQATARTETRVARRAGLRWVGRLRESFPIGDR